MLKYFAPILQYKNTKLKLLRVNHNLEGKLTWEEMIYQPIFKTRIPTAYVYDEANWVPEKNN